MSDFLFQHIGWSAWVGVFLCCAFGLNNWQNVPASWKKIFFGSILTLCFSSAALDRLQMVIQDYQGVFTPQGVENSWGGTLGLVSFQCFPFLGKHENLVCLLVFFALYCVFFFYTTNLRFSSVKACLYVIKNSLSFLLMKKKHTHQKKTQTPRNITELLKTDASQQDAESHIIPPLHLLNKMTEKSTNYVPENILKAQGDKLAQVLSDFGVRGTITDARPGPVVTLYQFVPAAGVKSSRVIALADDIARSMSALSTRVSVIAGQNAMGIELPNQNRAIVSLRRLLEDHTYQDRIADLPLALGHDISGTPVVADLARMPHLLVAGTTGSGKSVAINTMILSLLYRLPPHKCKFIMIDPKMLELSVYNGIPHLLSPVVTAPKKAIVALKWVVKEMENRYQSMSQLNVRNIHSYNNRIAEATQQGEDLSRRVQTGTDPDSGKPIFETQSLDLKELPFIVVIVDEMADLMLVAGKEVEAAIQRLAQMARAAGIHLIMATQRPSVDVITGTIKANFPTRVSFQVTSKIDSRTILGEAGAEQLLGKGDMLYMVGGGRITRVHAPFVGDKEVEAVVNHLSNQGMHPTYVSGVTLSEDEEDPMLDGSYNQERDPLYEQVITLITREKKASTSFIQRHFQIGYNRSARIVDQLEKNGIVSPANHVGRRQVLVS